MSKSTVAIVGGGPSALMAALHIDTSRYDVSIYEQGKRVGSKLLVAGNGGFNLTHGTDGEDLLSKYDADSKILTAIRSFGSQDLREWLSSMNVPTFVGSSNRVFPKADIKPIFVLNQMLEALKSKGVKVYTGHQLVDVDQGRLTIRNLGADEEKVLEPQVVIFALGGGSWSKTGSNGKWINMFAKAGFDIKPLKPSNCGLATNWSSDFVKNYAGLPIKNVGVWLGDQYNKGEIMITDYGLEGGVIYACSSKVIHLLSAQNEVTLHLDLKPNLSQEKVLDKLTGKSISKALKQNLRLKPIHIELLQSATSKAQYHDKPYLSSVIKKCPIKIVGHAPIDEAISTSGGLTMSEVDGNFQLQKWPHHYAVGEMLDWDTITGGYLLQACFSMGVKVAQAINSSRR